MTPSIRLGLISMSSIDMRDHLPSSGAAARTKSLVSAQLPKRFTAQPFEEV